MSGVPKIEVVRLYLMLESTLACPMGQAVSFVGSNARKKKKKKDSEIKDGTEEQCSAFFARRFSLVAINPNPWNRLNLQQKNMAEQHFNV